MDWKFQLLSSAHSERSKTVRGMKLEDEYEQYARECQRMAENTKSDTDRAAWLRIAQQWLRML